MCISKLSTDVRVADWGCCLQDSGLQFGGLGSRPHIDVDGKHVTNIMCW